MTHDIEQGRAQAQFGQVALKFSPPNEVSVGTQPLLDLAIDRSRCQTDFRRISFDVMGGFD